MQLLGKFLRAGIADTETGLWFPSDKGVPQGGPLSPLLSNIIYRRKALNYQVIKHNKAGLRHRSVRALLTHTAPTSSQRVKRRDG